MIKNFGLRLILFIFTLSLIFPSTALAQTKDWSDINTSSGKACAVDEVATIQGFECLFYNVLQVVVFFAGIASFFMFIVGGFKYLFSGNDPKKTAVAASTLSMAIIGLVGVIASWLILSLIHNLTGVDVLNFKIPGWQ